MGNKPPLHKAGWPGGGFNGTMKWSEGGVVRWASALDCCLKGVPELQDQLARRICLAYGWGCFELPGVIKPPNTRRDCISPRGILFCPCCVLPVGLITGILPCTYFKERCWALLARQIESEDIPLRTPSSP